MTIRIICTGKVREKYYRDAAGEYVKRLSRYAKVEIAESADEKAPEGAPLSENRRVRRLEGERMLRSVRDGDYVIACAIGGKSFDSAGFSGHLEKLMNSGKSTIDFVIGGSLGLDEAVLLRADESISFSPMTFPHQLMRVILLEQIYRAFRIMRGEPYHK